MRFANREEAGKRLAEELMDYKGRSVVYGLPRGGVVVALEVAHALDAPLDLILVRKVAHPANPEYAVGAVAEDSEPVLDESARGDIRDEWLERQLQIEAATNRMRRQLYFPQGYHYPSAEGKTAIIVDDGMATGYTMVAAVQAVQHHHPKEVVVAVPVSSPRAVRMLQALADRVVVLGNPALFRGAVGAHYDEFAQVEDEQVEAMVRS